jgi:hypothetical protein
MKKLLYLFFFISFFGYSQNPIQTISKNLNKKLDLKNSKFRLNEVNNFNRNQKSNKINSKSFNRKMMVNGEVSYRLDRIVEIFFDYRGIYIKTEYAFDENGNQTLDWRKYFGELSWLFSSRHSESIFDENGNNIQTISYTRDSVPSVKQENTYDENGNRILSTSYNWNSVSQSFVLSRKNQPTYDENGNLILSMSYSWNLELQTFVPSWKEESTFNENGNNIQTISYEWNLVSQSFVPYQKYQATFDENGNRTSYRYSNWDSELQSLVLSAKYEFIFDENGNQTLYVSYNWNSELQTFVPNRKEESTFNENGHWTLTMLYEWNLVSQSFVPYLKYQATYDENGNQTLYVSYNWNSVSQSYVPYKKEEKTYDENGNNNLHIYYNWDTVSQSFESSTKVEYAYDENNFRINKTNYYGLNLPMFKMDISNLSETETKLVREGIIYHQYNTGFDTWNEYEGDESNELGGLKSYWYYTKESSLSNNSVELSSFSIYPNPTNDKLFVQGLSSSSRVSIYNVLGKLVLSQTISKEIDVKQLSKGIYILKIIDGQKETTRKFIKY